LNVTVSLCPVRVPVTVFPSTTTCCSFGEVAVPPAMTAIP
jgi:hypothetical protein